MADHCQSQKTGRTVAVRLHDIAHSRAGDKGNRLNLSLFAFAPCHYPWLVAEVTEERVWQLFSHRGASAVRRYLLPNIDGMNFVIDDVLEGGVNASLNLDGHGKSLSFRLLSLVIRVPAATAPSNRQRLNHAATMSHQGSMDHIDDLPTYSPAGHTGTSNARLVSRRDSARFELVHGTIQSGDEAAFHYHDDTYQAIYVTAGAAQVMLDDAPPRVCEPGSIIRIPPLTRHYVKSVGEEALQMIIVYSPPLG